MWDPDVCPDCGAVAVDPVPRNILLYRDFLAWEPTRGWCSACEHRSRWSEPASETLPICPRCGSEEYLPDYPEIPNLASEPGIALMLHAEGHIPRDERGAILPREMLAWLRLHGVRSRWEALQWEEWFVIIGAIRAGIEAEVREASMPGREKKDDE